MFKAGQFVASVRKAYRRSSYTIGTWVGGTLVVGAIAYTAWRIGVESQRPITGAEEATGEFLALLGGIAGSFLVSRSAIRGHARSAFRRLLSMYNGLGEIAETAVCERPEEQAAALARIEAIATVHYGTAWDALHDWSDLAPQQVAELRNTLMNRATGMRETREDEEPPPLGQRVVSTRGD